MNRKYTGLLTIVGLAAFLVGPVPALAQTKPPLVPLQQFSVLGSSTVTAAGIATITDGDVGVSPGTSITGNIVLAPGFFKRTPLTSVADANLLISAMSNASNASTNLLGQGPGTTLLAELGGTTIVPGVYSFTSTANVASGTTFHLNAGGDPNAVWIFLVGSAITANTLSSFDFVSGVGNPCNVFWRVGSDATIEGLTFPGTVIAGADAAGAVTVGSGTHLFGRAVSLTGAVTNPGTGQIIGGCAAAVVVPPPPPAGVNCPPGGLTANGESGTATVTLSAPAPVGGTLVTLTSSAPGTASVPVSVLVPEGATSVTFTVTPGATPGNATITATTGGGTASCTLIVAAVVVTPAAAAGGPTLDSFGLAILLVLLAVAGVLAVNRFAS